MPEASQGQSLLDQIADRHIVTGSVRGRKAIPALLEDPCFACIKGIGKGRIVGRDEHLRTPLAP